MSSSKDSESAVGAVQADEPIDRQADDQLNRAGFARRVAEQILAGPPGRGFVVGIVAPWGSGKTSLLNLIVEEVEAKSDTVILRFDPWLFGRTDELVARFFHELASQFRESKARKLRDIGNAIARYGDKLMPLGWVPFAGGTL